MSSKFLVPSNFDLAPVTVEIARAPVSRTGDFRHWLRVEAGRHEFENRLSSRVVTTVMAPWISARSASRSTTALSMRPWEVQRISNPSHALASQGITWP
jgi:hypothetical protein